MGLLSRLTASFQPNMQAEDHVLLLLGLVMMAGADGIIETSELDTIQSYWTTLPEFRGKNFGDEFQKANKVLQRYGTVQQAVAALGEIQSETIRKKCYVLAADLAMSSGDVDQSEDALLDSMQRVLNVDDATARKVIEVLAIKYAA